ncbi:MAG: hypothetical protein Q8J62_05265 [Candidatus Cloacimonadaceae bacterium]|nr:hypothetical protein [Candidatus Cloacimonadaceae bacterium]
MSYRIVIIAVLLLCSYLSAATLTVALDGSGQFTSIQTAIETANHGDMVLVHPGRYYENIDFIGKQITVCSLEATTGNTNYIGTTIIDGSGNGSCVAFRNAEQNGCSQGL